MRILSRIARNILWFAWQMIRLPLFSLLLIFEPVVRYMLSWLTVCSFAMALIWEFSGADPRFPFFGMMAFAVGCALLLVAYHALLRLLS